MDVHCNGLNFIAEFQSLHASLSDLYVLLRAHFARQLPLTGVPVIRNANLHLQYVQWSGRIKSK